MTSNEPRLDRITAGLSVCAAFRSSDAGILCFQNYNMFAWLMFMWSTQPSEV